MTIKSHFEGKMNVPSTVRILGSGVGAATADLTSQKGMTFTRTGAGAHTVTLPKKFSGLLMVNQAVVSTATAAVWTMLVVENTVATDGKFKIVISKAADNHTNAPTATDLATTDTLLLDVTVEDSAVKPAGF